MSVSQISHPGEVVGIKNGIINVKIVSTAACVSCKAKEFCNASDKQDKIFEIPEPNTHSFHVGDHVIVSTDTANSMPAVLLAYVLPAVLLMAVILVGIHYLQSEVVAALLALSILALYYGVLYLFRHKMARKIIFTLRKETDTVPLSL